MNQAQIKVLFFIYYNIMVVHKCPNQNCARCCTETDTVSPPRACSIHDLFLWVFQTGEQLVFLAGKTVCLLYTKCLSLGFICKTIDDVFKTRSFVFIHSFQILLLAKTDFLTIINMRLTFKLALRRQTHQTKRNRHSGD